MERKNIPLPAVAAGKGPFAVNPSDGTYNFCVYPREKEIGLLAVPLENTEKAIAIRAHEYGHLILDREKITSLDIAYKAEIKKIHNSWLQAGMDVIVNSFLIQRGCLEIKSLPLSCHNLDTRENRSQAAQIFIRSQFLNVGDEIRKSLIGMFSTNELEFLQSVTEELSLWGKSGKVPEKKLLKTMRKMQRIWGAPVTDTFNHSLEFKITSDTSRSPTEILTDLIPEKTIQELTTPEKIRELSEKIITSKDISAVLQKPEIDKENNLLSMLVDWIKNIKRRWKLSQQNVSQVTWGPMQIEKIPLAITHASLHKARRPKPGYVGAFRYPHRALLPSGNGAAFAYRKRAIGGTILLDYSGSMYLSSDDIDGLLKNAPMATIACYVSNKECKDGSLAIMAKQGRMIDNKCLIEWCSRRGRGNVIDGPALYWLIKQEHPRIWISDGKVTGIGDEFSRLLAMESKILLRKGDIKQYRCIDECLKFYSKV